MENLLVSKSFTFDFAHALNGYDGPCKNIHGHTYHLEITVFGAVCTDNCPTTGMVMDFKQLKHIVNTRVIDVFDHSLVLNGNSPAHCRYAEKLQNDFGKIILLDRQPTCENLLLEFKQRIEPELTKLGVLLYQVKLQETPTSSATWNIHLNEITNLWKH